MASLEDVRRFIREHADLGPGQLETRLAKDFGMSREEAARMVADLGGESAGDLAEGRGDGSLPAAAMVAVGGQSTAGGTGGQVETGGGVAGVTAGTVAVDRAQGRDEPQGAADENR
jgi:hypothetical protein